MEDTPLLRWLMPGWPFCLHCGHHWHRRWATDGQLVVATEGVLPENPAQREHCYEGCWQTRLISLLKHLIPKAAGSGHQ